MKKQKQYSFFKPHVKFHGGALLYRKRKGIRPLSSKDSIHFELRSQWAMGADSFLARRNHKAIQNIINRFANRFGVRIYQQAINSNHIHLLLRITNRILYRAFIKAISGKIASHVMGSQSFRLFSETRTTTKLRLLKTFKNNQLIMQVSKQGHGPNTEELSHSFWQFRPFSRVVNWGKDFNKCTSYLKQNILEALGFIPYTVRKNYYAKWLNETVPDLPV